jgi:O-antigen/teichoic acid export membrane protein
MIGKIRESTVIATRFAIMSRVSRYLLQIAAPFVIFRFIGPSQVGIFALAALVMGIFDILTRLGIRESLIRHPETIEGDSSFWAGIGMGVFWAICVCALAPYVALFFGEPELTGLLRVLSLSLPLSALGIVPQAMLSKKLRFGAMGAAWFTAELVGLIVAAVLVAGGKGAWSLVAQCLVVASFSSTLMVILSGWLPRFRFDFRQMKMLESFNLHTAISNLLVFTERNGDSALIGKFLGRAEVGHYTLAYKLLLFPLQNVTRAATELFLPVTSQLREHPQRLKTYFLNLCQAVALLCFPIYMGMIALAEKFVSGFLSDDWNSSIPVIRILAIVGMLQCTSMTHQIFMLTNHTALMRNYGLIRVSTCLLGFAVGIKWGISGVALGYLVGWLVTVPFATKRAFSLIHLSLAEFAGFLIKPLLSSVAMFAVVLFINDYSYSGTGGPEGARLRLTVGLLVGAVTYVCTLVLLKPPALSKVIEVIPGLREHSHLYRALRFLFCVGTAKGKA